MLEPRDTVGHFQIQQLGAGGMGVVYLAEDLQLGRRVALKVLTAERDPVAVRRFLREAQAASALDHPNIATVFEVAETHSPPFIAMAYCPGETLRDRIVRGPLSLIETCAIVEQIALALDCAHASGVVHRDLKPATVMVHLLGETPIRAGRIPLVSWNGKSASPGSRPCVMSGCCRRI